MSNYEASRNNYWCRQKCERKIKGLIHCWFFLLLLYSNIGIFTLDPSKVIALNLLCLNYIFLFLKLAFFQLLLLQYCCTFLLLKAILKRDFYYFSPLPLRERKSFNYCYCNSCKSDIMGGKITNTIAILGKITNTILHFWCTNNIFAGCIKQRETITNLTKVLIVCKIIVSS